MSQFFQIHPENPQERLIRQAPVILYAGSLVPEAILEIAGSVSRWILVVAIAALGVRTSIQAMLTLGKGQIALVVAETLFLLVSAIVALNWIFTA